MNRGLEELQYQRVAPIRRVRHIDNDLGLPERFGQSRAGERVDARVRRRRQRVVAGLAQLLDELALVSTSASRVSSDTPSQVVPSLDHFGDAVEVDGDRLACQAGRRPSPSVAGRW